MSAAVVVRARGVGKTFFDGESRTTVLDRIDLEIARGEFVGLVGPSGAGKSTLLSILGTLLRPTRGEVEIAGQRTATLDDAGVTGLRNRHVGFVFQFHHLLPDFTALENVLFPSYARYGRERAESRARAETLLRRIGLAARMQFPARRLSGGEKQRVAVARAVMMRPDVVLADEPTGNLDRRNSAEVMELLEELAAADRTAFLISTHAPEIAGRCERVLHLLDGRLVAG